MSVRNFNMDDALMAQQSHVKRQHFLDNKAAFVAFDADFDLPFETDWDTSITASENLETDASRDSVIVAETQDVTDEMIKGRTKAAEVKYFVNKAFPLKVDRVAVLGEMRYPDYENIGNSQKDMAIFLANLYKLCNGKYKVPLLAANFLQPKIDEINTIREALTTENIEQDTLLQQTPVDTNVRIDQLNETFEFWHRVNSASKVIFINDLARLNLFLFPVNTEDPVIVKIQGTTRNQNNTLLQGVSATIESLGVTVISDSNGQFVIGGIPAGTYTIKFNKVGYQELVISGVIVPAQGSVVADAMMQAI